MQPPHGKSFTLLHATETLQPHDLTYNLNRLVRARLHTAELLNQYAARAYSLSGKLRPKEFSLILNAFARAKHMPVVDFKNLDKSEAEKKAAQESASRAKNKQDPLHEDNLAKLSLKEKLEVIKREKGKLSKAGAIRSAEDMMRSGGLLGAEGIGEESDKTGAASAGASGNDSRSTSSTSTSPTDLVTPKLGSSAAKYAIAHGMTSASALEELKPENTRTYLDRLALLMRTKIAQFRPQDLALVCHAYATLGCRNDQVGGLDVRCWLGRPEDRVLVLE